MTRLLEEHHSINFAEADLRKKLSNICIKLYKHDVPWDNLETDEQILWASYSVDDILFFLTGQREHTPNFTEWLRFTSPVKNQQPVPIPPQPWLAFHSQIDQRNIIQAPNPFQRLVRSGAK